LDIGISPQALVARLRRVVPQSSRQASPEPSESECQQRNGADPDQKHRECTEIAVEDVYAFGVHDVPLFDLPLAI
jgi:hypothetical protein